MPQQTRKKCENNVSASSMQLKKYLYVCMHVCTALTRREEPYVKLLKLVSQYTERNNVQFNKQLKELQTNMVFLR